MYKRQCIDGIGIKPDVVVKSDKDYEPVIITSEKISCDEKNDKQLAKGIEILKSK